MKLSALFDNAPDIEIENLMVDSRDVLPNAIFFCIKGMIHDGHRSKTVPCALFTARISSATTPMSFILKSVTLPQL